MYNKQPFIYSNFIVTHIITRYSDLSCEMCVFLWNMLIISRRRHACHSVTDRFILRIVTKADKDSGESAEFTLITEDCPEMIVTFQRMFKRW